LQMTIAGLPGSFWVVVAFASFGLCLIAFFSLKRLIFLKYKRAGESALLEGRNDEAIRCLAKAERLWSLNVANQSSQSFVTDITEIEGMLTKIELASGSLGMDVAISDYRAALDVLRKQFSEFRGSSSDRKPSCGDDRGSACVQLD